MTKRSTTAILLAAALAATALLPATTSLAATKTTKKKATTKKAAVTTIAPVTTKPAATTTTAASGPTILAKDATDGKGAEYFNARLNAAATKPLVASGVVRSAARPTTSLPRTCSFRLRGEKSPA